MLRNLIRLSSVGQVGLRFSLKSVMPYGRQGPRGAWDEKVVLDILVYIGMTVTGASYILYSVGRLLYGPVSLRAVEVLARTTLEMSARAWWMLDPAISVRDAFNELSVKSCVLRDRNLQL